MPPFPPSRPANTTTKKAYEGEEENENSFFAALIARSITQMARARGVGGGCGGGGGGGDTGAVAAEVVVL